MNRETVTEEALRFVKGEMPEHHTWFVFDQVAECSVIRGFGSRLRRCRRPAPRSDCPPHPRQTPSAENNRATSVSTTAANSSSLPPGNSR